MDVADAGAVKLAALLRRPLYAQLLGVLVGLAFHHLLSQFQREVMQQAPGEISPVHPVLTLAGPFIAGDPQVNFTGWSALEKLVQF